MLRQQEQALGRLTPTYPRDRAHVPAGGASSAAAADILAAAAMQGQHCLMTAAAHAAAPARAAPAAAAAAAGQSGPLTVGQLPGLSAAGGQVGRSLSKLASLRCPGAKKRDLADTPVSALLPDTGLLVQHINQQVAAGRTPHRTAVSQLDELRQYLQDQQPVLGAEGFNYQQMLGQLAAGRDHHAERVRPLKQHSKAVLQQLQAPGSQTSARAAGGGADSAWSDVQQQGVQAAQGCDPQWQGMQEAGGQHTPLHHAAAAGLQLPQQVLQDGLQISSWADHASAAAAAAHANQEAMARSAGNAAGGAVNPKAAAAAVGFKRPGPPASKAARKKGPATMGNRQRGRPKGRGVASTAVLLLDGAQQDPAFLAAQPRPPPAAAADEHWQAPGETGAAPAAAAAAEGAAPWEDGSRRWQAAAEQQWEALPAFDEADPMQVDEQEAGPEGAECAAKQGLAAAPAPCGGSSLGLLQAQHTSRSNPAGPAAPAAPATAHPTLLPAGAAAFPGAAAAAVTSSSCAELPVHPQLPSAAMAVGGPSCRPAAGTPASQHTPTAPQPQAAAPASRARPVGVVHIKREPGEASPSASPTHPQKQQQQQQQQPGQQCVHIPAHPAVLIKQEPEEHSYQVLVMITTGKDDSLLGYWERRAAAEAAAAAAAHSNGSLLTAAAPGAPPVTAPCDVPAAAAAAAADAGSGPLCLQQQPQHTTPAAAAGTGSSLFSQQQQHQHTIPSAAAAAAGAGSNLLGLQKQHHTPAGATGVGTPLLGLQQQAQHTMPAAATGPDQPASFSAATGGSPRQPAAAMQQDMAQDQPPVNPLSPLGSAELAEQIARVSQLEQSVAALRGWRANRDLGQGLAEPAGQPAQPQPAYPFSNTAAAPVSGQQGRLPHPPGSSLQQALLHQQHLPDLQDNPCEQQQQLQWLHSRGRSLNPTIAGREAFTGPHSAGCLQQDSPCSHPAGAGQEQLQQQQQLSPRRAPGQVTALPANSSASPVPRPLAASAPLAARRLSPSGGSAVVGRITLGQLKAQLEQRQQQQGHCMAFAAVGMLERVAKREFGGAADVSAVLAAPLLVQWGNANVLKQCREQFERAEDPGKRKRMLVDLGGLQQLLEPGFLPGLQHDLSQQQQASLLGCVTALLDSCRAAEPPASPDTQHTDPQEATAAAAATGGSPGTGCCSAAAGSAGAHAEQLHAEGDDHLVPGGAAGMLQGSIMAAALAMLMRPAAAQLGEETAAAAAAGTPRGSSMQRQQGGAGQLQDQLPDGVGVMQQETSMDLDQPAAGSPGADDGSAHSAAGKSSSSAGSEAAGRFSGSNQNHSRACATSGGQVRADNTGMLAAPAAPVQLQLGHEHAPGESPAEPPAALELQPPLLPLPAAPQAAASAAPSAMAAAAGAHPTQHPAASAVLGSTAATAAAHPPPQPAASAALGTTAAAAAHPAQQPAASAANQTPQPAASAAPDTTGAAETSHSPPRPAAQAAVSATGSAGVGVSSSGAEWAASSASRLLPVAARGVVPGRRGLGGPERATSNAPRSAGGVLSAGGVVSGSSLGATGVTEGVDLFEALGELLDMCIAEHGLLDGEQLIALRGALEEWQREGPGPLQLARFSVDYKWVLLCRDLADFTVEDRRAAMLYLLSNINRSTADPGPALLCGWSSNWLRAEAGFMEGVRALQGRPQLGEELEDVFAALSKLVQRTSDDCQAKLLRSKMQWVAVCHSTMVMQDGLQNPFDQVVAVARDVLQAAA